MGKPDQQSSYKGARQHTGGTHTGDRLRDQFQHRDQNHSADGEADADGDRPRALAHQQRQADAQAGGNAGKKGKQNDGYIYRRHPRVAVF